MLRARPRQKTRALRRCWPAQAVPGQCVSLQPRPLPLQRLAASKPNACLLQWRESPVRPAEVHVTLRSKAGSACGSWSAKQGWNRSGCAICSGSLTKVVPPVRRMPVSAPPLQQARPQMAASYAPQPHYLAPQQAQQQLTPQEASRRARFTCRLACSACLYLRKALLSYLESAWRSVIVNRASSS